MLDAVKAVCSVTSVVFYANVWYNGQATNIWNGDRYFYADSAMVNKIPDLLPVGKYVSHMIRPAALAHCKRCSNMGHKQIDPNCPTHSTEEVQETIDTFRGGKCELLNLHKCPHSCECDAEGTFLISEQYYQFCKLKAHNKGAEAYEILMEEVAFKAMKAAKTALPEAEVSEEW